MSHFIDDKGARSQLQLAVVKLRESCGLSFESLIQRSTVDAIVDELQISFRRRIFTPFITIWTFLNQILSADKSCVDAVAQLVSHRVSQNLPSCSAETTSYCKARSKLAEEFFYRLMKRTGLRQGHNLESDQWNFHDRDVVVVDGTVVSMPAFHT